MCNKLSVGANMKPLAEWDCATSDATRQIEISSPIIVAAGAGHDDKLYNILRVKWIMTV